ncbi:MAG: type II secretion system F family protein [Beijerinckiaceae bacterium]
MFDEIITFLADDPLTIILAVATAVTLGIAALGVQFLSVRRDVKRRASRAARETTVSAAGPGTAPAPPEDARKAMVAKILASVDRLFGEGGKGTDKVLRKQLIQAGFYSANAPTVFMTIRLALAIGLGALGFAIAIALDDHATDLYMKMLVGAGLGYFGPIFGLGQIVSMRQEEHRMGFPDFLDLMVVCCEAGLSMEGAINRVCREMADAYPSLSANLYFATLEVRAGRTVNDALSNMADRLGIPEARTFATLLQQSSELGSSLVDSLKIYSDDMRNKRMMRAEEKANQLPSKMTIPMMLFIFPIIFIILLFPAYMQIKDTFG